MTEKEINMKTEDLKSWGLTEEQSAKVMEQFGKDITKLQKENDKLAADRDKEKERADTAEETLKKFDGIDPEKVQTEIEGWRQKAEQAERDYAEKIKERDIRDKVNEKLSGVSMKDDMKDFVYEEILKTGVSLNKNGELIGFDEGLKSVKEKRPSAFVDEQQEQLEKNRASFRVTQPLNQQGGGKKMTREDIVGIKDRSERQRAIAENISLFQ